MSEGGRVSKTQEAVLKSLRDGKNVREIATDRGVSLNSVYQVLHRLEERGLVKKQYRANFVIR